MKRLCGAVVELVKVAGLNQRLSHCSRVTVGLRVLGQNLVERSALVCLLNGLNLDGQDFRAGRFKVLGRYGKVSTGGNLGEGYGC
jgi:hypothetical protein